jgi:hypothetical protein
MYLLTGVFLFAGIYTFISLSWRRSVEPAGIIQLLWRYAFCCYAYQLPVVLSVENELLAHFELG